MKILKILLTVLASLAFVILIGVGYVWYRIAFDARVVPSELPAQTEDTLPSTPTPSTPSERTSIAPTSSSTPQLAKPIEITTDKLSDGQQKVLDTLGLEETKFTITPGMVECAVEALGSARVAEIQKGATPSLSEGLTLLSCTKR